MEADRLFAVARTLKDAAGRAGSRAAMCALICAVVIALCPVAQTRSYAENKSAASGTSLKSAEITVRSGGRTLKISGTKWYMLAGRSVRIHVSAKPSANLKSAVFSSSNSKVASVSSGGKVTAKAKGTAKVTATITGKDGKTVNRTVKIVVFEKTQRRIEGYRAVTGWEEDVNNILDRYDTKKPQKRVLFYGNSSIRRWKTLRSDMSGMKVLNHGFGGSTVDACLYYADELVIPFAPKAVVMYIGTNDIAHGYSVDEVFDRTKELFEYIHCRLPDTQIYYISMPYQPKRAPFRSSIKELNSRIKRYCKKDPLATFINASADMNKLSASERATYFISDGIHLKKKGYAVWTKKVRPVLVRDGYAR